MQTFDGGRVCSVGACLMAVLVTGCIVHPKTVTSTRTVERRVVQGEGRDAGPVELATRADGRRIVLTAMRARTCRETTVDTVEVTRRKRAEVDGMSGGGEAAAVAAIVFLPVTLLSAVVTAAVVAGDKPRVSLHERESGSREVDCSALVSGVAMSARLPSGARVDGVTNARGELVITVPSSEPQHGVVRVWVAGHVEAVAYGPRPPSLARAR